MHMGCPVQDKAYVWQTHEGHGCNDPQRLVVQSNQAECSHCNLACCQLASSGASTRGSAWVGDCLHYRYVQHPCCRLFHLNWQRSEKMHPLSPWQFRALSSLVILSYILRFEARPQQSDLFKQIDLDLHNFRAGISIDMVEQVYCSNSDQGEVAARQAVSALN